MSATNLAATRGDIASRAAASLGSSSEAIYRMVAGVLARRHPGGGMLLDVGCGRGDLWPHVAPFAANYLGVDVVRYEDFPAAGRFIEIDLDTGNVPLPDGSAEVVAAVEIIEHLENSRAFFRELCRLVKPGGLIVVTTPNQLSLLSKLTLLTKNQFNAFQEAPGLYPAHITALLEIDLLRIARECSLKQAEIYYSGHGRIPFTSRSWPRLLGLGGRFFSDNVMCIAQKPTEET